MRAVLRATVGLLVASCAAWPATGCDPDDGSYGYLTGKTPSADDAGPDATTESAETTETKTETKDGATTAEDGRLSPTDPERSGILMPPEAIAACEGKPIDALCSFISNLDGSEQKGKCIPGDGVPVCQPPKP